MAKKSKQITLTKFKALKNGTLLGRQKMATLTAQRFGIGRNQLLSATLDSMIEAWRANKPELLARLDGSKLMAPMRNGECAELRQALQDLVFQVSEAMPMAAKLGSYKRAQKALAKR